MASTMLKVTLRTVIHFTSKGDYINYYVRSTDLPSLPIMVPCYHLNQSNRRENGVTSGNTLKPFSIKVCTSLQQQQAALWQIKVLCAQVFL